MEKVVFSSLLLCLDLFKCVSVRLFVCLPFSVRLSGPTFNFLPPLSSFLLPQMGRFLLPENCCFCYYYYYIGIAIRQ